mgnify:CR=1 FL=1
MTPNPTTQTLSAKDIGLYIHWPFCAKKCPYCDFNSHVRDSFDSAAFLQSYEAELEHQIKTLDGHQLVSIFFGGGTPSLMPADVTKAIIDRAAAVFNIHPDDIEITLEANPNSVEAAKFQAFRRAGVNRVSVGVQSFQDDALKFLGRLHGADEAIAAIKLARETFERYSFDLIYARPEQTLDAWRDELEFALNLAGDHLSLYQLTIEPGTAFYGQYHKGKFQLPNEDLAADLYQLTNEMTAAAGLTMYEISNYARPGFESLHNKGYWQGRYYVGLGPGAHGRLPSSKGCVGLMNHKKPEHWLKAVAAKGHGVKEWQEIDAKDRAEEMVLMGLRMVSGLDKTLFRTLSGYDLNDIINQDAVATLVDEGLLSDDEKGLKLTPAGLPLLDAVLRHILT